MSILAALVAPDGTGLHAALIALCLALWLGALVPAFVPTLLMLTAAPLVLSGQSAAAATRTVLSWAADPVLALFFGGLAAGAAARKHGLDERVARFLIARSGGSPRRLVALLMIGTAALSMWMSNVAAAAMMIGAARPALQRMENPAAERAGLVGLAMAANVAGLSTPIGSGPNGIAIAALATRAPISFVGWMLFGVPLACGLLVVVYLLVRSRLPIAPLSPAIASPSAPPLTFAAKLTLVLVALAIAFWLAEPWLGVPAAVVSLGLGAALFSSGALEPKDLAQIDWSTLFLIAGGVVLGRLTEATGLLEPATTALESATLSPLMLRTARRAA